MERFMAQVKNILSKLSPLLLTFLLCFLAQPALAAESSYTIDGGALSIWWIIPFAGILLSIAIFPLVAEDFWHHHFGKVSAFWGVMIVVPMLIFVGFETTLYEVLHVYLLEYIPFIILLFALFTISGGVRVKGYLKGTPEVNTLLLFIGTILASWMGTTGAAMLLIRPMLRANQWRKKKVHMVIFFIFLVANVGGSLTPLGDPPLFLGFLQGVDFFWTTTNLFWEMSFVVVILLTLYYFWDRYLYAQEEKPEDPLAEDKEPLGLEGSFNLLLLAGVVGFVLFSGIYDLGIVTIYHVDVPVAGIVRDSGLLLLSYLSWIWTSKESRAANGFDWFPIQEVGKLFAGIFITIIAPIAMLKAGKEGEGALQFVNDAVFSNGEPNNAMFFWVTGMLSGFLDNAPTYLVFFNAAGGDAQVLMNELSETLVAVSAGAVFFGALTYIGNAPNFMVKSIADTSGVDMPSFGGYMLWSVGILLPIYLLVTWIFI
jgi:Na+/H+ antiporter NhaD/arsenite permease-like protein